MTRESSIWQFGEPLFNWSPVILLTIYRFFERIAKTYRREHWQAMLTPLLSTWYACAQRLGDVELSIKLLIEMLGHGMWNDLDRILPLKPS